MNKTIPSFAILMISFLLGSAGIALAQSKAITPAPQDTVKTVHPLVTFVELGSVKCVPCRQMQPVMKAIEQKYKEQVKVVFHDVWQLDQAAYAQKYGIRVIPTQVFLDKDGQEFFRHEGFYPETEIDKLLQKRGLKVRT